MALTQFQGGNMKSEDDAENLWMNDFWNRIDTVQNVWRKKSINLMEYLQSQVNDVTHKRAVNIPHSIHATLTKWCLQVFPCLLKSWSQIYSNCLQDEDKFHLIFCPDNCPHRLSYCPRFLFWPSWCFVQDVSLPGAAQPSMSHFLPPRSQFDTILQHDDIDVLPGTEE